MIKKIISSFVSLFLVAAVAVGIFFFIQNRSENAGKSKSVGSPSITSLATQPLKSEESQPREVSENTGEEEESIIEENKEEISAIDEVKNDINIIVLNGGAALGSAGKIKKLLEDSGYVNAAAADALSGSHIGQMVYYRKGMEDTAEKIKDIVKENYPGIDIKEGKTAEQTKEDIVIMLGK